MADEQTGTRGGFHFGNVGGSVGMKAGQDIVAGDKTTTTTTTIQRGFAAEEQKQQFEAQLEQLRQLLQDVKKQIEVHPSINPDQKSEVAREVLEQAKALTEIKETVATVPIGKPAPPQVASKVENTLEQAGRVVEKFEDLAKKAGGIGQLVAEFGSKYVPLIASARHLFGLP